VSSPFLLPFSMAGLVLASLPTPLSAQGPVQNPKGSAKVPEGLSTSAWSGIRAAYEAGRHQVRAVDGGFQAWNPAQRWHTRFDGRGFTVTPDAGGWSWGLELQSYGFLGQEQTVTHPAYMKAEGGRVDYAWDANLTEWYRNDIRGLEHGFTVHERPATGKGRAEQGPLTFRLAVRGGLHPEVAFDGRRVRFLDGGGVWTVTYMGLSVSDATGRSLSAHFERVSVGLRLLVDEQGASYPLTIDPIAQQVYLKASNPDPFDRFAGSVSVSGDTVVFGAIGESSSATGVDGDETHNNATVSGAAYVFVRDPQTGTWSQQAYLKASNTDRGDQFGESVSISGDTAVIGAIGESSGATGVDGNESDNSVFRAGAAYVFVRDPLTGTWSQQAYLKASNTDASDRFGISVSVSEDTVVVGADQESSNATGVNGTQSDNSAAGSGAAYVFVRDPQTGIWSQQAYLKASNTDAGDVFGFSVSVSGDTLGIGAFREDSIATGVNGNQADNSKSESGAAYVFVRDPQTGIWSQQAYLKASNTDDGDFFGISVSLFGDTFVVGALGESSNATGVNGNQSDNSAFSSGAGYVFVRDPQTGIWSQQAYLKASNPDASDQFGRSVSISGDMVVGGAFSEDSSASGVNGNGSDNSSSGAGAAYVFVRDPQTGTWSQQAYLKASNPGPSDEFGASVSVSGETVVVGAPLEDSGDAGVNGNQCDNSTSWAGAGYVFSNHAILAASSGVLSIGSGRTIDYAIDFPAVDAGAGYQILLSVHGMGPTNLNGLRIPLTRDNLFRASLHGNTPPFASGFQGILDANGDAAAHVSVPFPPTALPLKLFGRSTRLYLAVINSNFDLSSTVRTLCFSL